VGWVNGEWMKKERKNKRVESTHEICRHGWLLILYSFTFT
jgi:hypothetical protein